MHKRVAMVAVMLLMLLTSSMVLAHPGRTDSNGGHWNRKEGTYHYHNGGGSSGGGGSSKGTSKSTKKSTITITGSKESMAVGETLILSATKNGVAATWKSSDSSIASVDSNGTVTAISKGKVTITATIGDESKSVKLEIKQNVNTITVMGEDVMQSGKSQTLKATVFPDSASKKSVSWSSGDKKIATVDSEGVVTVKTTKEKVKVTIYASAKDGSGVVGSFGIIILPRPAEVSIYVDEEQSDEITIHVGERVQLRHVVYPEDALQTISWTSSNRKIAQVDENDFVQGIAVGKTKITAKTPNGKTATIRIVVIE